MREDKMEFLRKVGLGKQVREVELGRCPMCGKAVHPNLEFRDSKSRTEFGISGQCQRCQDIIFGIDCQKCGERFVPAEIHICNPGIVDKCLDSGICPVCLDGGIRP